MSACSSGDGEAQLARLVEAVHGCLATKPESRWPLERVYDVVTDVVTRVGLDTAVESRHLSPPTREAVQPPTVTSSSPPTDEELYPILTVLDALATLGLSPDAVDSVADDIAKSEAVSLAALAAVIRPSQRLFLESALIDSGVRAEASPFSAPVVDVMRAMTSLGLDGDPIDAVANAVGRARVPVSLSYLVSAGVRGRDIVRIRRHLLVGVPPACAPMLSLCAERSMLACNSGHLLFCLSLCCSIVQFLHSLGKQHAHKLDPHVWFACFPPPPTTTTTTDSASLFFACPR